MTKTAALIVGTLAIVGDPVAVAAQAPESFVYAANESEGTISAYRIDPGSGVLTPVPGSPFATVRSPSTMTVGGQGRFLYAADLNVGEIAGYAIDRASGAPRPIPGSPFHPPGTSNGSYVGALLAHPGGRFVLALNPGAGNVAVLAIDPNTGALTPVSGSPYAAGGEPGSLAVDPLGRYVYAINYSSNNLFAWAMDPVGGTLRPLPGSPFPLGGVPGWNPVALTIAPGGEFAYLFMRGSGGSAILGFALHRDSGLLTPVGTPVPASPNASQLLFDPLGTFVYTVDHGLAALFSYQFDPSGGGLTLAPESPYPTDPTGYPSSLAFDPSGRYAYLTSGTGYLILYAIDADTGALQFNGVYPSGQSSMAVVVAAPMAPGPAAMRRAAMPTPKAVSALGDPNLPAGPAALNLPLRWTLPSGTTVPFVWFNGAWRAESGQHARYLGFNTEGSWLEHADDHHVYLWNRQTLALTRRFDSRAEMPQQLLTALQNVPPAGHEQPAATTRPAPATHTPAPAPGGDEGQDPNFPTALAGNGSTGLPVTWINSGTTMPVVTLHLDSYPNMSSGEYLGFNERGSWLVSSTDGKVYVWHLRTLSLLLGANSVRDIPKDVLRTLRNTH